MQDNAVLRVTFKLMAPFIMLFALYVQFHGEYGPGGGFQAGAIFGSVLFLYALIFGVECAQRVISPRIALAMAVFGCLLFSGTGVWNMFLGGNFLEYYAITDDPKTAQVVGIIMVELGVGVAVVGSVVLMFYLFAGRAPRRRVSGEQG